jgi:hypothetical protein
MKRLVLLLAASIPLVAEWEAVQRLSPDQKIEIVTGKERTRGAIFVSATNDALVVRDKSGERSIARTDIRRVSVADPGRRPRNGLIWTAAGAGTGAAIGWAICPHCANEGSGYKFVGPLLAIGGGLGALGFIPTPYRTVYKRQ